MAENFDLIFGQNASQQYAWSDNDYQNGWETIGNIPPTAAQFDALQKRSDTKMKELNDELTPLVNANETDNRQPSTAYSEGDIKYSPLLPTGWFLACTVSGTSSASELVVPSPVAEGDEITDGGVTWKVKKIGGAGDAGDGVPLGAILPLAHNSTLPAGYLLCDGSAVSRTMYPDLFAAIGTTYGAGDGSTTFNVPDLTNGAITKLLNSASSLDNSAPVYLRFTDNRGWKFVSNISSYGDSKLGPNLQTDSSVPAYDSASHSPATTAFANLFDSNTALIAYLSQNQLAMRFIIKAFDGQTPDSALIDITQYAQELATKANRQLSNLDTANLACHVVVDSYYDSTTGDWWREYDDGWVEQGGHITSGTLPAGGLYQITLLKAMADNGYFFAGNYGYMENVGWVIKKSDSTATVVNISQYNNGSNVMDFATYGLVWFVCGMGASA